MAPDANTAAGLRITVFGDFVCPWSHLAVHQVLRLRQSHGVEASWHPHWLHPEVPAEGMPYPDAARRKATIAWMRDVAPEMASRMRFPERVQFSFLAFEGLEFAREHGADLDFAAAVFDAHWVHGEDIAAPATLHRAAQHAGLDAQALEGALRSQALLTRTAAAVSVARRIGITATPTLFVGRTRIDGWHYDEVLQSILERYSAR